MWHSAMTQTLILSASVQNLKTIMNFHTPVTQWHIAVEPDTELVAMFPATHTHTHAQAHVGSVCVCVLRLCAAGQTVLKSGVQRQQCVSCSPCTNKSFHMVQLSELQRPAKRADHLSIKNTLHNKREDSASLLRAPQDPPNFLTKSLLLPSAATKIDVTFGFARDLKFVLEKQTW